MNYLLGSTQRGSSLDVGNNIINIIYIIKINLTYAKNVVKKHERYGLLTSGQYVYLLDTIF